MEVWLDAFDKTDDTWGGDSVFKVIAPLNGDEGYMSFEGTNYPEFHLRAWTDASKGTHNLWVSEDANELIKKDGSFKVTQDDDCNV
jgi:hypothetical protein